MTALHLEAPPGNQANFTGEFYAGRSVCGLTLTPPPPPAPVPVEPRFAG